MSMSNNVPGRYVVTGGSSGLGRAIIRQFSEAGHYTYNLSREEPPSIAIGEQYIECDVTDKDSLLDAAEGIRTADALVNCAGINHLSPFEDLEEDAWDAVMDTNAKGIFLASQAFLTKLRLGGTILNIISNASHMPMTHSAVYNASKGAAHILTLQMARELTKSHGITVFGISPAKIVGTGMSRYIEERVPELRGWTPDEAAQYQRQSLVTGLEIPPPALAEFVVWLLSEKHRHFWLSGCVIPYGA